jgi:hypothetical protein
MKKKNIALVLALFSKTLFAEEVSSVEMPSSESRPAEVSKEVPSKFSSFYAGPEVYALSLSISGIASDFHATLAGAVLGYTYKKPNSFYFDARLKWAIGEARHTAQPSRFIHDELVEGQLGYVGQIGKFELIPFVGFGFHYLIENRKESSSYTGMKTSYRDYYFPLGLKLNYYCMDRLSIGLNFTWWKDVDSTVKISGLHGAHWVLDRKDGYRLELPVEGFLDKNKRWSFCLEPFWQQYQLGADRTNTTLGRNLGITTQTFNYYGGTLKAAFWF